MKKRRLKKKVKITFVIMFIICIGVIFIINNFNKENIVLENTTTTSTTTTKVKRSATLTFVGDLLFESPFYNAIKNGYNMYDYFENVKSYFEDDDLTLANMEVVIGNDNLTVSGDGYNFCAPSYIGDLVSSLSIEILSTTNNHTFDRGIDGIKSTINYFKNSTNIKTVGTYSSVDERNDINNYIIEKNGIKFGIIAYTYGTNQSVSNEYKNLIGLYRNKDKTINKELLSEEITNLRNNIDVLIVMMHWGTEFTFTENSEQTELALYLNSLGVDIIYGSHSHSIEPVDMIGDEHKTLVYYSLGNFTSQDDDIARTEVGFETYDNAYQFGLLSKINIELDDSDNVIFNNIDTDIIVNYFDSDMKEFKLIPLSDYKTYENKHLRYSLGLTYDFIYNTYTSVIDSKYRD